MRPIPSPLSDFPDLCVIGYLQSRIIFFLMVRTIPPPAVRFAIFVTDPDFLPLRGFYRIFQNIHNRPRTIYFARSGQSLIEHSYKADSDLSPAGWDYAERLKEAVMSRRRQVTEERKERGEQVEEGKKLVVWTSARRRAYHTAWPFVRLDYKVEEKPQMSEINVGLPFIFSRVSITAAGDGFRHSSTLPSILLLNS